MSLSASRGRDRGVNYWPGFVDGLAALLVVVIFLVMIFVLAQMFLSEALSGRDEALERLNRQIDQLASILDLERTSNAELRVTVAQLSAELQSSTASREDMSSELAGIVASRDLLLSERDALAAKLAALEQDLQAAETTAEGAAASAVAMRAELEDAFRVIAADKEKIELQLRELERLSRDVAALQSLREELEGRVAELAAALDVSKQELEVALAKTASLDEQLLAEQADRASLEGDLARLLADIAALRLIREELQASLSGAESQVGSLRDTTKELEARLADEAERTLLAQRELEDREIRLREMLQRAETAETSFAEEAAISSAALQQIELLNRNITALRQQLAAIEEALEISEARNREPQTVIANLGQRLNAALATKVAELARYRSEFFGRLREKLGERPDVRIEGDRFVFQSEVLFASGQAELREEGLRELVRLASTLKEIATEIPTEIDWVLRIDGHTDAQPIATPRFPSNWELSSVRAISVVKFMVEQGVEPRRLLAAGFGEFHPLDPAFDEVAFRRNRRIEFKLTQR